MEIDSYSRDEQTDDDSRAREKEGGHFFISGNEMAISTSGFSIAGRIVTLARN